MVWRALNRLDSMEVNNITSIDDARLLFNLTDLMSRSTETDRGVILDILYDILTRVSASGGGINIRLPVTEDDAYAICLRGKYSIFPNIPHPAVFSVAGHACVSLNEVLSHIMAHGVPVRFIEEGNGKRDSSDIHGSKAASEILYSLKKLNGYRPNLFYGLFMLWSDSFINSWIKQRDNSVWILTATFFDVRDKATSPFHTRILAIGSSKLDHQPVIEHYLAEIETIRRGVTRYCGIRCSFIDTAFDALVYLADRPERCSILKTLLLGSFGKRSLFASGIDVQRLPHCPTCFRTVIERVTQKRSTRLLPCRHCCQWDFECTSRAGSHITPPKSYPDSFHEDSPIIPRERGPGVTSVYGVSQTIEWLTQGIRLAEHNVRIKHWKTKATLMAYLNTFALNENLCNQIWENRNATVPVDNVPKTWGHLGNLDKCVDTVMHHLFHGIVPSVMSALHDFMKEQSMLTTFHDSVNIHLSEISSMRLDWCKIKTLPKKLWLAEDVLGFTRVFPFVYHQFFELRRPNIEKVSEETLLAIKQLANALGSMIGMLMTVDDTQSIELIDAHVSIFLSCCDRFVKSYYDPGVEPFWAKTGNFPSLKNLPRQIQYFGPLRWYWEGTRERYIQQVKQVLVSMRKTTSYFEKKLIYLHTANTSMWIKESIEVRKRADYYGGYHRYQGREEVMKTFTSGKVLSGVMIKRVRGVVLISIGRKRGGVIGLYQSPMHL